MRVISGKFRRRKLLAPAGLETRPTSDRLRETLFNVAAPLTPGSVWIDLFAGSGAVGIEALSRDASKVYFVESDHKAARAIRENLKLLGIAEGFELLERDGIQALQWLNSQAVKCDVCFLDPPYSMTAAYAQTLKFLSQSQLLHPNSIVIAEHDKRFDPGDQIATLARYRKLRQGDAVLSFYRRV